MIYTNRKLLAALIDDFLNLELVRELFNVGKFTTVDADWFRQEGFNIICADGKVERVERAESL